MSVSCIIPFYNEKNRINHVISTLLQSLYITQIVCIDDGSTDDGHVGLTNFSSRVEVFRMRNNHGKAEAVKTGVKRVKNSTILMMDADLIDVDINELNHAIESFEAEPSYSMLIFQMKKFMATSRLFRGDILFSGIRLIRASVLRDLFTSRQVKGYQLELSLNDFCLRHRLRVATYPFYADSVFSIDKLGLFPKLIRDLHTYPSAIAHVGIGSYISQLFWFAKESIKKPARRVGGQGLTVQM